MDQSNRTQSGIIGVFMFVRDGSEAELTTGHASDDRPVIRDAEIPATLADRGRVPMPARMRRRKH